jgi:isopentenyldiphosphate isomerase
VVLQDNDPDELLEIFDADGRPTGVARSRAEIHLAGDWHQAFHCWIVRPGPQVVVQRRSLRKDTFAGFWDASAAGHWRFGESAEQAAREIAEELGLQVAFEALRYQGRERLERAFDSGIIDREHHQVYVLEHPANLLSYRPDRREVSALAAVPTVALLEVLSGRIESVRAAEAVTVHEDGTLAATELEIARDALVPYDPDRLGRILGIWNADC